MIIEKVASGGIRRHHRSRLGPHFMFLSVCTQAQTVHDPRAQQHPRGPGVGTLRASDRGADCRLPYPSRKGHWQDGPLQSGDRWASPTSQAHLDPGRQKEKKRKTSCLVALPWVPSIPGRRRRSGEKQQPSFPFESFCIVSIGQRLVLILFLFKKGVSISLSLGTQRNNNTVH